MLFRIVSQDDGCSWWGPKVIRRDTWGLREMAEVQLLAWKEDMGPIFGLCIKNKCISISCSYLYRTIHNKNAFS